MNISIDIKPVIYLKTKAADLLKQVNETRRPVIITQNGEPRAVLQDPEGYEKNRKTIGLLKIFAFSEEEIKAVDLVSSDGVFKKVKDKL